MSSPSLPGENPTAAPRRSRIGGISRRVRTLVVAAALFLTLLVLTMTLPVPYVILSPGPTYNTLGTSQNASTNKDEPIIKILGHLANKTTGNLNLTTVSYSTQKLTVFDALSAWLQNDQVVVPRSALFPPGKSTTDVNKQNTADFATSQDNAVVAAACELGYPKAFGVLDVVSGGPSNGLLKIGDVLISVNGRPAGSAAKLRSVMQSETPRTSVPVRIRRGGVDMSVTVKLGPAPKGAGGASLGILIPRSPECIAPFKIDIGLGNEIGGPSAGMMFALGIIDKVGKVDLTKGRFIAGTGTIDPDGKVGPIGGIQLKMIAARNAGATVFLAPADNCSDVNGAIPSGLQVVKVSTLHNAVQDLKAIGEGQPVAHC